jgi:hypothetical protein
MRRRFIIVAAALVPAITYLCGVIDGMRFASQAIHP